jgi:glycosyltransferase involved in cell wall biosynthesis
LSPDIAVLTEPNPQAFADGILKALNDPEIRNMVERARQVAEEKYSYREYLAKTSNLYSYVNSLKNGEPYLKENISEKLV